MPTQSDLYNSILNKMREEGYGEQEIEMVAEYLCTTPRPGRGPIHSWLTEDEEKGKVL